MRSGEVEELNVQLIGENLEELNVKLNEELNVQLKGENLDELNVKLRS